MLRSLRVSESGSTGCWLRCCASQQRQLRGGCLCDLPLLEPYNNRVCLVQSGSPLQQPAGTLGKLLLPSTNRAIGNWRALQTGSRPRRRNGAHARCNAGAAGGANTGAANAIGISSSSLTELPTPQHRTAFLCQRVSSPSSCSARRKGGRLRFLYLSSRPGVSLLLLFTH